MMKSKKTLFMCTFTTFAFWYSIWFASTSLFLDKQISSTISKKLYPYSNMKYILQWTKSYTQPFIFMESGQKTFIKRHCHVNNCFITSDRGLLNHFNDFDAILFHGPEISTELIRLPRRRSKRQIYVFVSMESSANYPIRYNIYAQYFNWTWTYKLSSDVYFGYIIIKNKQGDIIGPNEVMHWLKVVDMEPIDDVLKQRLGTKRIAAAWFVSHCEVSSKRSEVAKLLQKELAKYSMTIDIYGMCGTKHCSRFYMKKCLRMLETDYYFYLAFENAISEDYVTEKVLHALQHYTVPIVYGGANYTRFMPEGSYLNVQPHNIEGLVKQMVDIIYDKNKYYDFFRWTNYYTYHYAEEVPETDYYCTFCRKINDNHLVNPTSSIKDFRQWWNPNFKDD